MEKLENGGLNLIQIQFNSVTSITPKSSETRDQSAKSKSKSAQCRESKLKSSTGHRISEELGGGGGGRPNRRRKVFSIFLNEVTVLAILKLPGSEFQVEGAATAKALDPHFVRKRGTVNIFVLEDLSNLEF